MRPMLHRIFGAVMGILDLLETEETDYRSFLLKDTGIGNLQVLTSGGVVLPHSATQRIRDRATRNRKLPPSAARPHVQFPNAGVSSSSVADQSQRTG